jgi:galactose-1-phosphate uridylyltransferase
MKQSKNLVRKMSEEKFQRYLVRKPKSIDEAFTWIRNNCVKSDSYAVDPRDDSVTIFCSARNKRPNGYVNSNGEKQNTEAPCPLCDESIETTPIILSRKLRKGVYAFVNENLYPFLTPQGSRDMIGDGIVRGAHFLIWPTTEHRDIHEISYRDHVVSFELMADLESRLIESGLEHVQFIKNTGKVVGGSVEHGHYQAAGMNVFPMRIQNDVDFLEKSKESFVKYLSRENPKDFKLKDYGSVSLVVPYFMRRPFNAIIYPNDFSVNSLRDLGKEQRKDFARATSDIANVLSRLMPSIEKEFAYNFVFHTGPIGTMYIEVLPYTQGEGGFEKAGLSVCQSNPEIAVREYRQYKQFGL